MVFAQIAKYVNAYMRKSQSEVLILTGKQEHSTGPHRGEVGAVKGHVCCAEVVGGGAKRVSASSWPADVAVAAPARRPRLRLGLGAPAHLGGANAPRCAPPLSWTSILAPMPLALSTETWPDTDKQRSSLAPAWHSSSPSWPRRPPRTL